MSSPYRSDDAQFPWISKQEFDGKPFRFMMISPRSVSWYSNPEGHREYMSLIKEGDTVVDAGANEGYTSILAALKTGPKGRVLAIEPAIHNAQPLVTNISLNRMEETIKHLESAVVSSDAETTVPFIGEIVSECVTGESSFTMTLDSLITVCEPNVIKLDIEGYEVKALRGGMKIIDKCRPLLFIELHLDDPGVNMRQFGDTPEQLFDLLKSLDYSLYRDGVKLEEAPQTSGAYVARPNGNVEKDRAAHPEKFRCEIPKAYCIALKERKTAADWHLSFRNLKHEMFEAIDGRALTLATTKWSGEVRDGKPYYSSAGQIGCLLSHRALWQKLLSDGVSQALVLEDDALLPDDFADQFCSRYARLPDDWQFVFVGAYHIDPLAERVNEGIVIDRPWRTHAYLVRISALPILLESTETTEHHIDVVLRAKALPKLKHYCFWPSIVKQRTAEGEWESRT